MINEVPKDQSKLVGNIDFDATNDDPIILGQDPAISDTKVYISNIKVNIADKL